MGMVAENRFCRESAAASKKRSWAEQTGKIGLGLDGKDRAGTVRRSVFAGVLTRKEECGIGSGSTRAAYGLAYDLSRIAVYSPVLGKIRAKLKVNTPGDVYEQEADAVVERVLRVPLAPIGGFEARAEAAQSIGREATGETQAQCAPAIVDRVLESAGQMLESSARTFMEPRFGHDFGRVRVHTDGEAARSAQAIGAKAYTAGKHIVFGPGQYNLATGAGLRLLAHELTHTLQSADLGESANDLLKRDKQKEGEKKKPEEPAKKDTKCAMTEAQIRPVFFRNDPGKADQSPTGKSLNPRLKEASRIWGKCGIEFKAAESRMVEDSVSKIAGKDNAELDVVQKAYGKKGTGPQVFFLDNDLSVFGGGRTGPNVGDSMSTGDDAKVMLSDHGSNDRLLAHELGHAMGLLHPDEMPYIPKESIMEPSGIGKTNPDLVTDKMCSVLAWPPKTDPKCWHVDPDPKDKP
jgi:hypothetical protein